MNFYKNVLIFAMNRTRGELPQKTSRKMKLYFLITKVNVELSIYGNDAEWKGVIVDENNRIANNYFSINTCEMGTDVYDEILEMQEWNEDFQGIINEEGDVVDQARFDEAEEAIKEQMAEWYLEDEDFEWVEIKGRRYAKIAISEFVSVHQVGEIGDFVRDDLKGDYETAEEVEELERCCGSHFYLGDWKEGFAPENEDDTYEPNRPNPDDCRRSMIAIGDTPDSISGSISIRERSLAFQESIAERQQEDAWNWEMVCADAEKKISEELGPDAVYFTYADYEDCVAEYVVHNDVFARWFNKKYPDVELKSWLKENITDENGMYYDHSYCKRLSFEEWWKTALGSEN